MKQAYAQDRVRANGGTIEGAVTAGNAGGTALIKATLEVTSKP